jgi:hypothetical protein
MASIVTRKQVEPSRSTIDIEYYRNAVTCLTADSLWMF